MTSFQQHPLPDIGRAVEHSDALGLTCVEETNGVDIHLIHLFQIQSYLWIITTFDLGFHLINVLNSESPAQPNPRSPVVRNLFDREFSASLHEIHCG